MKKGLIIVCVLLVAAIVWGGISTSQKNAISTELDSVKAEMATISSSLTKAQKDLENAKTLTDAAVEEAKLEAQVTIDTLMEEKTALEGKITELNDQITFVTAENVDLKDNLQGVTDIIRSALALIDGKPEEEIQPEETTEEIAAEEIAEDIEAEVPVEATEEETPVNDEPLEETETVETTEEEPAAETEEQVESAPVE